MQDDGGGECLERGDEELDFRCKYPQIVRSRVVDVLFVIDDGPEAGALQARLADAMDELASGIGELEIQPELRIGFTTSKAPNPGCPDTDRIPGQLELASCLERRDAFVDADGTDRFAELCESRCELGEIATTPTFLDPGGPVAPRPWLETFEGAPNLSDGVELGDALRCASLVGVDGCSLAAPFEATRLAFLRADLEDEAQSGFFRRHAPTILVWVGSGTECSMGPNGALAFDADGSRELWTDPERPTPGLCWSGGVACTGPDAEGSRACEVMDVAEDGTVATPDVAVLQPVSEIAEFLEEVHARHSEYSPITTLRVLSIGGLPPDWTEGPIPVHAAADDPTVMAYAVEPTCTIDGDAMLPPLRQAAALATTELADTGEHALVSACTDDFGPYMSKVVEAIGDSMIPACNPSCVADVDPDVDGLQVDCRLEAEYFADGEVERFNLADCDEGDGVPVLPAGEIACYATRTGEAMSELCRIEGWNLEFDILWNGPMPLGTSFIPTCKRSQDKERDCPDL